MVWCNVPLREFSVKARRPLLSPSQPRRVLKEEYSVLHRPGLSRSTDRHSHRHRGNGTGCRYVRAICCPVHIQPPDEPMPGSRSPGHVTDFVADGERGFCCLGIFKEILSVNLKVNTFQTLKRRHDS